MAFFRDFVGMVRDVRVEHEIVPGLEPISWIGAVWFVCRHYREVRSNYDF